MCWVATVVYHWQSGNVAGCLHCSDCRIVSQHLDKCEKCLRNLCIQYTVCTTFIRLHQSNPQNIHKAKSTTHCTHSRPNCKRDVFVISPTLRIHSFLYNAAQAVIGQAAFPPLKEQNSHHNGTRKIHRATGAKVLKGRTKPK